MFRTAIAIATTALAEASAALPSAQANELDKVSGEAQWWAHIDDRVFYNPPTSMVELSQDASKYYYAIGASEGLTAEMKQHRVGGHGRWHIFHLPQGPSMLQLPTRGSRHEGFSSLMQLEHGQVLANSFPEYTTNESYAYPGSDAMLESEKAAVQPLTDELYKDYLTKITTLGVDKDSTRSNVNPRASKVVVEFLQKELQDIGLNSCLQKFSTEDGERENVVAYIPGSSRETLTVGAHYDSRPYKGAAPGANDNGSGLALLLAVAKAWTQSKMKPVKDMYLVGFAAEEEGLLGSAAFVKGLTGSGSERLPEACRPKESFLQQREKKVTGPQHSAIIIDEVGWKSPDMKPTVTMESRDDSLSFNLLNHLAQANKQYNNGIITTSHSNNPFGSDHMSFIDKGFPAVLLINGNDEGYPSYHSSKDTMAMVDIPYASELTRMAFGGVVRVAGVQA